MHPKQERTLVLIKPDGIQRTLIGEIIKRYEKSGLKLTGLKMLVPTEDQVRKHYLVESGWKKDTGSKTIDSYNEKGEDPPFEDPVRLGEWILEKLVRYLTTGPVIAMVWEGMSAVGVVRKLTGSTEPLTSDVGTIRGDYTLDSYHVADQDERSVRNLVHASGSIDEAKKEIEVWFQEDELIEYNLVNNKILYDINLDGILE